MPAPKANRNARKGTRNMTTRLQIRCTKAELRGWKQDASFYDMRLADYVRHRLQDN